MKVREEPVHAKCEFCGQDDPICHPVKFSRAETILVLCETCIDLVIRVLVLVHVKESEA